MERSKLHQKQQVLLQQRRRRLAAASQSRHVSADPSAAESSRSRGTTSKGSNARQQQLSSSRPTTRSTPPRHDNCSDQEVSIFDSTSNVDIFSSGSSVDEINNIGRQKKDERRGKNKNGNFDSKLRDQYSHSQPHWKHKERLRQLGQQSRRSALVASAMGGMVMQGVSISGDNDKGSRKSQTPSQPQFSAAIVTPEKRTEAMSGRDKGNSMKAEVVPPDQCQDDGVEVDEFWNFFDSQQSDFLRSPEAWPQQGQGQLNRGVQIITPPRHKSQSSNFPNEPVQSSRSHSQNGIPSSIDNGTNNSSSRSSQQQFSPAVAVTPEKGDKPLLRPFSTSAFNYDNNSKTTDQKSSDINGFEGGEEGVEIDLDEFWNHFDSQHSHSVRSPKRLPQLPHEQLNRQSPPLPTKQNMDSNYSPKSSERLSQNKPQSTVSSSASSPPSPSSHQQSFQSWPQHLWPELPSDPPPVASASTHQADNTKNLSDNCDARNTQSNGPQPKQQSFPTSSPQTTAPKKLNPKLLSQFEKYSAESLQQQAQQPQKRQQNQCHHQLHHQQEQPQQQHDPRHAGQPQNEHSLNLPHKIQQSQNSQAHSTSAANTSTSSEDYQFNFDFSDESFGNGSDEKGCQRSDDHDNCFGEIGDFDNGFAVSKSSYAGFDDNRTARKENINELFATGNDQFRTETSISLCWDDISTPIVGTSKDPFSSIISHSDKPSSPSSFSEVWNKGEEFCHEDSSSNNNNFGDKSISGGVNDDFMNWRRINLEDVSGKVDCEEDDNDWIHWEDPFELMESMKSSNCSEDMKPSHQNKFNASPDRTTVMTSDVSNDSSVKVALSLSNDDTFNRTTATASTDKSASNQNKIVRRIAVDPPSSTFPRTSVKATAARFNKVAGKTSHNAPNSQETPRTLPPQPSESIPSPRTPQTSNTTAKSSSSTANSMGMAIHKLEMAEYSPPLDEVYSSASIASSSARKPQHDQPLLNSSEGLQKFGPHPLSTPSSNPLISSPIISIHGDSSIFPDDDSIFSNFSHLRQMRMQTNVIKNSGVSPARNSNKQGSNIVNNSNNTNLSSSANVASVGSCNDVLNFSERKNHSTQTIQIEETSLTVTHTPSLKANRSCNEMSSSEANIIPSSTKRPPPQTLQGSPSNFRPGFSQARPSSDYEKADEKIQVNPRTLLWEGQLLQGIRSDYSNSTRSFEIPEENANIMAYLVENAVQEATWSKKPQSPVSDSKKIFGKNPSKRHWPPPHPTTPLEPKAALISRHYNSLANAISPSGHHATQSPTRSDHSADAAAGVKHGMQMRSGMFEPSELNAESDTTGLDTRGCGNHSKLLQTIETKVDDERSKDDSLASKLVKLSQSTGKKSGGGASHHDDAKSVSSSKVSGGISLQPSLESECLRQNAAIAMEMDEMMAFFHENHQDVGSQPGKNETSRMTDPMNYEFLTFSQFDLSPEDSVEVAKDPPDELITTETTLMSSKKDSKITSAPPIKTSSIPNTNRESRVEQVFTSKSSYYSNQHLPRSNHLSSKFSSDKRHFISLLSVDEESEFEEPRWDPTNDTSSSKKSPDVKVSEKNELTQFMDTIMRGCYLHGGENSDVLSYRDEIGDANIILPEVDDANNARDDTSFLHDQNKPSKKCPQINLADSFERISKERARIRREDTTPLRTNKSKAKEAIAFYEGKPLNTAIPPLRADLPKPAQSPESESNNHKTYAECTSGKRILDSDRQFSLAQSKMATTTQCHDERSRKRDSIFDEDVLKSYRATQNSDVIESYRMQDRKMPAVSKSLDEDRVDDNSQTAAKKLLQLDGKENEPNRDKLPKEHDDNEIIMSKIDLHERSEEEPAGYEEKVYGRRCGKLQEVSTNRGAVAAAKVNKSESFPSNDNQGNGSKETKLLQTSTINQVTSAGMSERENSKGVALAWQSPNEVDEDQILFPEDRLNRPKVTSSGRTSLVSMVQHSAALREHFRDSRSNTFGVRNPLYNPNLTFDHTIHEGSNEDSDDESGEQITKEDEAIPEYQYESFIRDFKDVLDNDPTWNTAEAAQTTEPLVVWSQDKRESKSISGIASYEITNPRSKTNILPPITERRNHVAMARTTFEKRLSANGNATRPPQNQLKHKVQLHDTGLQDNILCSNITNTKHPLEDSIGHFHAIDIRSAADSERIEGSNHSKIPYNNLASNEQTNSRLEEKLRGLSNVSGKECGNSVATSELGSLLTRDSEVSHKFVPRSMFHRTHPSTHVATLRPSPSTIHNTFDDKGCIFATENELDAELNRKSYDDVNFNGITSSRARNAVPGPSAPITDTEPSVASKIKLGVNIGYLAVKSNNLHSSNVHAASAITRRNATSSDTHPSGFLKETNRFWTSRTKTPIKCRSSPEQHEALASAGQVKKAAAEYERKNMDNFGNQMEKNAKSSETKKNGVDKNKYSYKKRMPVNISAAEDGSQVSLSEAFDIAPRVQRNAKNGCIQNFRVCNVVNGGFKDNIENSGAFADSSLEDSTFRAIRDVFESSSQNAFEIAPKEKQELTRVQLQICSSHNISSKRTEDKSCTQIDKKQAERVKSSPFMKHVWTRQMKKLNIGVSENSKKPPMRPMSVLARGGNGIRKKHAEV